MPKLIDRKDDDKEINNQEPIELLNGINSLDNISPKISKKSKKKKRNIRVSDQLWKERVKNLNISNILKAKCDINCKDKKCMQTVSMHKVDELQTNFWGSINSSVFPSRKKRLEKIHKELEKHYNSSKQSFSFMLDKNTEVCEASYLAMLGLSNTYNKFRSPNPWIGARKILLEFGSFEKYMVDGLEKESNSSKEEKCIAYIKNFIETNCDELPIAGMEGVKVLPFATKQSFYDEYVTDARYGISLDDVACLKTFVRALKKFKKSVRFMRCKGNFSKCEICSNAAYLLRTNTKLPKEQRDIILHYRRIHLKQQLAERIYCEQNKTKNSN